MSQPTIMIRVPGGRRKEYILAVLQVLEHDSLGRPSKVMIGYDDTKFNVQGGEEFWTAFLPVEMSKVEEPS